ncbi:hypothetical protein ACE7GA_09480 [Roseomonas sp. CCTCC AB2023176]|uniref:hypothetical protein n=1 Tax=Roseomonas sp. CCTCC AB2023176 TaxID=3342640 RepID=UPI0035D727A8
MPDLPVVGRSFIFGPMNNDTRPNHDHNDATGAFHPAMRDWQRFYGTTGTVTTCFFNNGAGLGAARVQQQILDAMYAGDSGSAGYDAICYFGHGTKQGLETCGWYADSIASFTDAVDRLGAVDCKVVLYACSCAEPGGIAYRISENLRGWWSYGLKVYGHSLPGHSTRNPTVRVYPSGGGEVGFTLAPPRKIPQWIHAIRDDLRSTLWARFPFMTQEQIEAEL